MIALPENGERAEQVGAQIQVLQLGEVLVIENILKVPEMPNILEIAVGQIESDNCLGREAVQSVDQDILGQPPFEQVLGQYLLAWLHRNAIKYL